MKGKHAYTIGTFRTQTGAKIDSKSVKDKKPPPRPCPSLSVEERIVPTGSLPVRWIPACKVSTDGDERKYREMNVTIKTPGGPVKDTRSQTNAATKVVKRVKTFAAKDKKLERINVILRDYAG